MNLVSPITNSQNITVLKKINSEKIINLYKKIGFDVSSSFLGLKTIDVCRCEDSKLVYFSPKSVAGDARFYEALDKNAPNYYSPWKWEHEQVIKYVESANKILEIGCAYGTFLKKAKSKGISNAIGLELNENAIADGIKNGLDIKGELIAEHKINHVNYYDLICSFQVVEHIAELKDFFADSIACLKPGGLYAISVPNNECYLFSNDPDHTLNLPPHHINLWEEQSLRNIAPMFGLSVLAVHKEPANKLNYGNYYEVFLRNTLKLKGESLELVYKITRPIVKLAMRLLPPKYGACITVIYQKQ